jgi:hypothetical protein
MSTQTQTTKKTRKPKTKRLYFGPDVDLAIIRYNQSEDATERSLIYSREIKAAFEKLVENITHTFKFYYTDDQSMEQSQHEVVSFLVERLPKFKATNGKAFSYFSIVAKNFCIVRNKNNYKKLTAHNRVDQQDSLSKVEFELADVPVQVDHAYLFMDLFVNYWDENLETIFTKKNDQIVLGAILELFRKRENIEIFNKKALYIYIREMTNASTQQVTKGIRIMKEKYMTMFTDYLELGYIPKNKKY